MPPSFPSTPLLDDFNRADGALGANWNSLVYSGGVMPKIASNGATLNGVGFCATSWATLYGRDQESYCDLVTLPASWGVTCYLRGGTEAVPSVYEINIANNSTLVGQVDKAGTETNPVAGGSVATAWAAGDGFGARAMAGLVSVFRRTAGVWNQAPVLIVPTATNSLGGFIGFAVADGGTFTCKIDNFGGGTIPPDLDWSKFPKFTNRRDF